MGEAGGDGVDAVEEFVEVLSGGVVGAVADDIDGLGVGDEGGLGAADDGGEFFDLLAVDGGGVVHGSMKGAGDFGLGIGDFGLGCHAVSWWRMICHAVSGSLQRRAV